ncbi:GNAT family N-acetyltransferase [Paenibacillus spongiae]|uniref:GNAT family N-acetyltransferase n=1 Tax=Paenibacillus spongiae TaxID=2909671 RepID=A0ABY5SDV1_9BACL|nr:GNAT family protein [Paenibacillus spongiae]UVI30690.1 GNAT family N-acetyltransferase [Paenibacillus spongiae]
MMVETERLILREFTHGDAAAVHEYASDPAVVRHMSWGPNTEEETLDYIHHMMETQSRKPRVEFEMAVILKETQALIGGTGIFVHSPGQGEIGYCYYPLYWGRGYAAEAAAALLRFGFQELGFHRIFATCRPDNAGSTRVMQKLGMKYEGHLRGHMLHNKQGRWLDSHQYSILKPEYEQLQSSLDQA